MSAFVGQDYSDHQRQDYGLKLRSSIPPTPHLCIVNWPVKRGYRAWDMQGTDRIAHSKVVNTGDTQERDDSVFSSCRVTHRCARQREYLDVLPLYFSHANFSAVCRVRQSNGPQIRLELKSIPTHIMHKEEALLVKFAASAS
jgi:hypothetical protein